ncbi:hypothetical protein [Nocardia donostiensis]|uniref:Uncharacterized protein n=1 Tax=Nocardia donostiensis TaxID=1538463 RepID=A0A1V2T9Q9_9NOCA|nr:hypothetical protein [Nocardia donostiensis]ONM46245.1 hypothetical protein B0T46_23970 [Nocardia donostiensis]OQS13330.1 hypothetical protein B0T36_19625 [Nocardia donostiensis]OQS18430.1 hypothetical protein B0T44_19720 [Nocardia donostiensis]
MAGDKADTQIWQTDEHPTWIIKFSDLGFRRLLLVAADLSEPSLQSLATFADRLRAVEGLLPDPLWPE